MNKLTLSEVESRLSNASWSGNQLRGDCPLCGGKNTFCAKENGKLLLHCHKCEAPFKELIEALGATATGQHQPPAILNKHKPTHSQTAVKARKIWEMAKPADPEHFYLAKKGIHPHGARQDEDGKLLLAGQNIYGEIVTIQTIDQDGDKRFMSGGKKKGSFIILNDQTIADRVYVCEGFATAGSTLEATGEATICAFDAGNLLPVTEDLRELYPDVEMIICGDNDKFRKDGTLKDSSEQNKGIEAATAAACAVGGKVCWRKGLFPIVRK